jgi:hypothetical protein
MYRNGKPFIKKGVKPGNRKGVYGANQEEYWQVFGKGDGAGSGEGKGEKAVSEKGLPSSPPQEKGGQMEFGFAE